MADINKDYKLTEEEVTFFQKSHNEYIDHLPKLSKFDKNGDGFISPSEFCESCGLTVKIVQYACYIEKVLNKSSSI